MRLETSPFTVVLCDRQPSVTEQSIVAMASSIGRLHLNGWLYLLAHQLVEYRKCPIIVIHDGERDVFGQHTCVCLYYS